MAQGYSTNGNVVITGTVDDGNSTSTPLNSAAVFTGTAREASAYSTVLISCYTDQIGTLQVQLSTDGVNWDSTLPSTVAANTNEVHRYVISKKYYRVVFTNTSASNQTYIRLQSILESSAAYFLYKFYYSV